VLKTLKQIEKEYFELKKIGLLTESEKKGLMFYHEYKHAHDFYCFMNRPVRFSVL
jgi:hypothetical protein